MSERRQQQQTAPGQHAIDMPRRSKQQRKAQAAAAASPATSTSSSRSAVIDVDDPYDTPEPASVAPAGEPFYDAFAKLEVLIAQASNQLAQVLRTLKLLKSQPQDAEQLQLGQHLSMQLQASGTILDELAQLQSQFNAIKTSSKLPSEEKSRRRQLRDQANIDIDKMRHSYQVISGAALQRTGEVPMSRSNSWHSRQQLQQQQAQQQRDEYEEDAQYDAGGLSRAEAERAQSQSLLSTSRGGGGLDGLGGAPRSSAGASPSQALQQQQQHALQLPSTFQRQGEAEEVGDLDGHLSMLAEDQRARRELFLAVSRDVSQMSELFADFNSKVTAQQDHIEHMDDLIIRSAANADAAHMEITLAQQYQAAKRRKKCCLFFVGIIALVLAFLFLWVAFGDDQSY